MASLPIAIQIGPGELVDRLTILELKSVRLTDSAARARAAGEQAALERARAAAVPRSPAIDALTDELRAVNDVLWCAEEKIRALEAARDFGPAFVAVARSIYKANDRRAAIKGRISALAGSTAVEDKSYAAQT